MRSIEIEFDDQHFIIDGVLDVCRVAYQSMGGVDTWYTYRIRGQEWYLWLEDKRWVVRTIV